MALGPDGPREPPGRPRGPLPAVDAIDVTETRDAEHRYRDMVAHNDRLSGIIEATSDLVVVTDADGTPLYLNRAAQEFYDLVDVEVTAADIEARLPAVGRGQVPSGRSSAPSWSTASGPASWPCCATASRSRSASSASPTAAPTARSAGCRWSPATSASGSTSRAGSRSRPPTTRSPGCPTGPCWSTACAWPSPAAGAPRPGSPSCSVTSTTSRWSTTASATAPATGCWSTPPPACVEALRPGDTVARFGGDEFVVLCEDLKDRADAELVAERVRGPGRPSLRGRGRRDLHDGEHGDRLHRGPRRPTPRT